MLSEGVGHLLHLLFALLDLVDTDVGDERDVGTHGSSGTRFAVFDGEALLWLDSELLASVDVDGRIRLGGWRVETGGGRVDVLVGEEAFRLQSAGELSRTIQGQQHLRMRFVFSREARTRGLAEVETTAMG